MGRKGVRPDPPIVLPVCALTNKASGRPTCIDRPERGVVELLRTSPVQLIGRYGLTRTRLASPRVTVSA